MAIVHNIYTKSRMKNSLFWVLERPTDKADEWSTRCPLARTEGDLNEMPVDAWTRASATAAELVIVACMGPVPRTCAPHACHFLSPAEQVWNITRVDLLRFGYCEPKASFRYNSTKYDFEWVQCRGQFSRYQWFVCVFFIFLLRGHSDWRVLGDFFFSTTGVL